MAATGRLEAAQAIGATDGYPLPTVLAATYLAHVAWDAGRFATAATYVHSVLPHDYQLVRTVPSVASLAQACGAGERAARLFGAAESLSRAEGLVPTMPEREVYERAVADLPATLGEDAFRAAWDAGAALPLDGVRAEMEAVLSVAIGSESEH